MYRALLSTSRILVGPKEVDGGIYEAAKMVNLILGSLSNDLASLGVIQRRFRVVSTQGNARLKSDQVSGFGNLAHLEDAIGYHFHNRTLLEDALSQLSKGFSQQGLSYQRIEYLGDAFIDVKIMEHWMNTLPLARAQELSSLHTKSTNRGIFSTVAVNICLEQHLHYVSAEKEAKVQALVEGLVLEK
ncbi:hypothetical protein BGZ49_004563 [Haplosporangium sp. Z 27]|nr:hypothetical protein BGZ49_004563 [Haplosporangium sp. Z 27]